MVTIKDAEELKKHIIECMGMLRSSLYNSEGHLYDASYFGGGEADRQNKLNLLNDYQEQLRKINDNEPIYGTVLLLKKKELSKQEKDMVESKRQTALNIKIGNDICSSVFSYIQYPDGKYHETYVLYKGHSDEYNTDFICYYDNLEQKIMLTPVQVKDGQLMKNPIHTQEMINAFSNQFLNQMKQGNLSSIEQLLQEIPSVMGNTDVDQYETVPCSVVIGYNVPPVHQAQTQLPPLPPEKTSNKKNGEVKMYSYKCNMNNIDVEVVLRELKKDNPGVIITADRIEGSKGYNDDKLTIYNFSVPIEELKYNSNGIIRVFPGNQHASYGGNNIIQGNYLEKYDYEQLSQNYLPKIKYHNVVAEATMRDLVFCLQSENPNAKISYSCNKCERTYKLESSIPFSEIKIPRNSRFLEQQYGFDKDGYIFLQSEKHVKFEVDEEGKVHETRPFYIDKHVVNYINEKNGYHYDASYSELETVKKIVAEIKSANPEIDIFIEEMKVPRLDSDSLSSTSRKRIITSSVDISKILNNTSEIIHAIDQEEYFKTVKIFDKEKVLQDFRQNILPRLQKNNLVCEIVDLANVDKNSISVKAKKRKSLSQALDQIYKERPDDWFSIVHSTDQEKCNLGKKGIIIDQIMFDKDKDGNGYTYFTKGETYTRYKCNAKGEFTEEHPFESKGNDKMIDECLKNLRVPIQDIPDLLQTPSLSIKDNQTEDNKNEKQNVNKEFDLPEGFSRMMELQNQTYLILEKQQQQILAMQQQIEALNQQNIYLQQKLMQQEVLNQNTMDNDIGKSM